VTRDRTRAAWRVPTDTMLDAQMREWILSHIAQKTVDGMAEEETHFKGVLYCGLMMTAKGPMVLEYNARFGDPETQAILPRMESDVVEALEACVDGRLQETEIRWKPGLRCAWWRHRVDIREAT